MKKDHDSEQVLLHMIIMYSVGGAAALILAIILQFTVKPDVSAPMASAVAETSAAPQPKKSAVSSTASTSVSEPSTEISSSSAAVSTGTTSTAVTSSASAASSSVTETSSAAESSGAAAVRFKVANCSEFINVRSKPDLSSQSLGKMNLNDEGEIIEQGDTWSLIKTGDDIYGYVMNKYLETE